MMKTLAVIFGTFVLIACSYTPVMNENMASWVDEDIDSVIAHWGYPDEQREINGRMLYVWHQHSTQRTPKRTTTTGNVDAYGNFQANSFSRGGEERKSYCGRILEVDDKGTVIKWEWKGHGCPTIGDFHNKDWRNPNER